MHHNLTHFGDHPQQPKNRFSLYSQYQLDHTVISRYKAYNHMGRYIIKIIHENYKINPKKKEVNLPILQLELVMHIDKIIHLLMLQSISLVCTHACAHIPILLTSWRGCGLAKKFSDQFSYVWTIISKYSPPLIYMKIIK